jgi:putative glutamine amidotransferase
MASEKTNYAPLILLNMAVDTVNDWENEVICSNYVQKLSDAGAIPFCMPSIEKSTHIETLLDLADGVLLIGGKDYHPSYYGQEPHKETNLLRKRPHFDIALGEAVMRRNFPVLGICAGCQLLNIVNGGELIQHLPDAEKTHRGGLFHQMEIIREGFYSKALGLKLKDRITVNSFHHQAVDPSKLGRGLQITALAYDGTVEVIEGIDPGRMIIGVQYHPERMPEEMSGLFRMLKN